MSDWKKISSPCFIMCFAKVIPWDTNDRLNSCLHVKCCEARATGRLLQPLEWCCFAKTESFKRLKNKNNPQKVFRQKEYWVGSLSNDVCSFIALMITTLTFYCTLYLIQNEWSTRLQKSIQKLSVILSMEVYLCLVLYIHDLRSQESEALKGVYGLKSFHLAEN